MYLACCFFLLGTILGSFYNVVGYRIPKGESILYPASHCPNCNHHLSPLELIPIFSFLFQRGKCKSCNQKISWFYPIFEFSCGILFALSYVSFGFTWELLIALTFCSMLIIVILSDYYYMIIPDEVLITFGLFLFIEHFCIYGLESFFLAIKDGILAFFFMFLLKKMGDFLFKEESMGGGDIKLLSLFGFVLGIEGAVVSIFLASIIGLPISLIYLKKKKDHIIPFGPFLSISAMILLLIHFDIHWLLWYGLYIFI